MFQQGFSLVPFLYFGKSQLAFLVQTYANGNSQLAFLIYYYPFNLTTKYIFYSGFPPKILKEKKNGRLTYRVNVVWSSLGPTLQCPPLSLVCFTSR